MPVARTLSGLLAVVVLACASQIALVGPVADQAAKVDQLAESGDFAGAMAGVDEMKATLWDQLPGIVIANAFPVTERSAGYGLYNARSDARYKQGEPIQIYAEPMGFGYGDGGEGIFQIGFYVDLQVLSQDGTELANMMDITQIDHAIRAKVREFAADVTYNFEGLGPGKYRLITTLRDKNSAKTGSFETEVEVLDEPWKPADAAPAPAEGSGG